MHRPNKAQQMTTPVLLQTPAAGENINGVYKKSYADAAAPIMCNFSTYGSTERESNGVIVVEENITVTTWYDPAIMAGCRVKRLDDGAVFEIVGDPENVEMRNMFCVFKVRRVRGGA